MIILRIVLIFYNSEVNKVLSKFIYTTYLPWVSPTYCLLNILVKNNFSCVFYILVHSMFSMFYVLVFYVFYVLFFCYMFAYILFFILSVLFEFSHVYILCFHRNLQNYPFILNISLFEKSKKNINVFCEYQNIQII